MMQMSLNLQASVSLSSHEHGRSVSLSMNAMHNYDDLVSCLDSEDDELERLEHAPEYWTRWVACKAAFKALCTLFMNRVRMLYTMCTRARW